MTWASLINLRTLGVAALAAILLYTYYLNSRVDSLKSSLEITTANYEGLQASVANLTLLEKKKQTRREETSKTTAKLTKDSLRVETVKKKPKLVEKMINDSIRDFTKDVEELSNE
ncbi:hypothetical protein TH2_077 [Shewanella phage Thanatos-2]|nr:hypothetical protein TH2_077 [Shewanella phage Thanatos-2]